MGQVLYVVATVAALDVLHDAWFYWTHRLLHWRPLYRHVHHIHHRCAPPCPAIRDWGLRGSTGRTACCTGARCTATSTTSTTGARLWDMSQHWTDVAMPICLGRLLM